jgi:RNA polymerase sigma-70 factor (ECF subfamily)
MDEPFPTREAGNDLHQRLVGNDPTAPSDLAVAFLGPLIYWLSAQPHTRTLHADLLCDAAEDAILALIRNPGSYQPEKADLASYLRMSAQGDLLNRLRREAKHHRGRTSLEHVEHSDLAGNYLGQEDDPSLRLEIAEYRSGLGEVVPTVVREGLTEAEGRVLELMIQGERKTSVYAEVCGIADLSPEEQRRFVKQVKDKLKKRLSRTRRGNERSS